MCESKLEEESEKKEVANSKCVFGSITKVGGPSIAELRKIARTIPHGSLLKLAKYANLSLKNYRIWVVVNG